MTIPIIINSLLVIKYACDDLSYFYHQYNIWLCLCILWWFILLIHAYTCIHICSRRKNWHFFHVSVWLLCLIVKQWIITWILASMIASFFLPQWIRPLQKYCLCSPSAVTRTLYCPVLSVGAWWTSTTGRGWQRWATATDGEMWASRVGLRSSPRDTCSLQPTVLTASLLC